MRHIRFALALFTTIAAMPAFAQFGALFQSVVESAAKQGAQQGVQQGVVQAISGAPAGVASAPTMVNGCYSNLPAAPAGVALNPDTNGNGCVDQNEANGYLAAIQAINNANTQARVTAPAPTNASALGSVVGSAVAVRNAGGTGNAAAWVAGQNALGAAANAARGQPAQQVAATHPADINGDGIVTAEESAAYQARIASGNGMIAGAPSAGPQGAVSNATAEVVGGAVSGALKGFFGR